MSRAFFDAVLDAYLGDRITADQANAWFRLCGFNLTVGV